MLAKMNEWLNKWKIECIKKCMNNEYFYQSIKPTWLAKQFHFAFLGGRGRTVTDEMNEGMN